MKGTSGRLACKAARHVLVSVRRMNRSNAISSGRTQARSWLAALLVALLFLLTMHSAVHGDHSDQNHSCAACLIAHGGVIADGAVGTVIFVSATSVELAHVGEFVPVSLLDLRLAPGRAPPV